MDTATAVIPYSGPRPSPARAWALWVLVTAAACGLGNAVLLVLNVGATVHDIISYRTYLAIGHAFRILTWTCVFGLVLKSTALQDRREMAAGVQQAEAHVTHTSAAFSDSLRTATRNCTVSMLAAGDPANEAARREVIRAMRGQGLERYDDDWIAHDLRMIDVTKITSYLAPLHRSLDQPGKEALVAQVVAVGVAGGTLTTAQVNVLEAMRASLDLNADELHRLVNAAMSPDGGSTGGSLS
jgi:hypothetical protein